MNKIFKKIWNLSRGCFVAVSEVMTSAGQNRGRLATVILKEPLHKRWVICYN